jgi:hypothetical protein
MPDEPGVFIVTLLCKVRALPQWNIHLTNQFFERWPSMALCVPTGLSNTWYSEEDIQAAKQKPSKTG